MFNKKMIAASLAAGLFSASAMAGTFTQTSRTFATELFGTGTVDITPATAVYAMAATPGGGSAFNVTYTLTGGTWGAALTSGSLAFADVDVSGSAVSVTLVEGGTDTASTAKFRVDVNTAITAADTFTLTYTVDGTTGLATPANTAKIAVSLVDTLGAVDTAGAATTFATSAQATVLAATAGASKDIDVSTNSTKFVGNSTTYALGTINLTTDGGELEDDGTTTWAFNAGDAAVTGGTVTINADFTASLGVDADSNAATKDGVTLTLGGGTTLNATTLTASQATFTLTAANLAEINTNAGATITMNVDGTTAIKESTPTGTFTVDYTNAAYVDQSKTLALAKVEKNGSSANVNLTLNPNGAFSNFIRVVNTSTVDGDVLFTVYNDDGKSVNINLSDLSSMTSSEVKGNSATKLLPISEIVAAATAKDSTFAEASTSRNKFRLIVEGEFSSIAVQNVTLATDNTTFSTF